MPRRKSQDMEASSGGTVSAAGSKALSPSISSTSNSSSSNPAGTVVEKKLKISVKLRHSSNGTSKKRTREKMSLIQIFSSSSTLETKDKTIVTQPAEEHSYDNGGLDDNDLLQAMPCCDALMVIRALVQRNQYAVVGTHSAPFVLRNMVHGVMMGNDIQDVGASTTIGQELEHLFQQGKIRMIRLFTGTTTDPLGQDVAVFEESRFHTEVKRILWDYCNTSTKDDRQKRDGLSSLANRFVYALARIHKMYVTETDLLQYMTQSYSNANQTLLAARLDSQNEINSLLLAGLLLPKQRTYSLSLGGVSDETNNNVYYLTLPGMGEACRFIHNGRQEMILRIQRSLRNEIKQTTLLRTSKPLRNSSFSTIFHLRDLLSTGKLHLTDTPCGVFVTLGSS